MQDYDRKILICGNHEKLIENDPRWFIHALSYFPSITYLQDSSVTINGVKFHGSPYSNEFCNWAFMKDELELSKVWAKIPDDTNVLITHGPAYGCNDLVKHSYGRDPHVGSQSLHHRKLALQDSLKMHVSGHIHEAYNVDTTNKCINICASILDEKYQLVNKPIIVEI